MDSNDSLLQLGKLSGQQEALSERVALLETRVEHSDRLILEKIEALQSGLQKSIVELQKNSSALDNHRKLIGIIMAASLAGGSTSAGIILNLIGA